MAFEQGNEYIANAKEALDIGGEEELKQLNEKLKNGNDDAEILNTLKKTNENFFNKLDIVNITEKIGKMISIFGEGELDIKSNDFEVNPHFNLSDNKKESLIKSVIDKLRQEFKSNNIIQTGKSDRTILKEWIEDNYQVLPFFNSLNITETTERIDGENMKIGEATVDNKAIDGITEKIGSGLGGKLTLIPRSTNDQADLTKEKSSYTTLYNTLKEEEKIKPAVLKIKTQLDNNKNISNDPANLYLRARRALKYVEALGDKSEITPEIINNIQINLVDGENAEKPGMDAKITPKNMKKANIGVYSSGLDERSTQQPPDGTIFSIESDGNTYYATYNYELRNGVPTPFIQFDYTSPTNIEDLNKNTNKPAIHIGKPGESFKLNEINSIRLAKKAFPTDS